MGHAYHLAAAIISCTQPILFLCQIIFSWRKSQKTQELEEMEQAQLRASADGAGTTEAEPAGKAACMEAGPSAGSPPSTRTSCFSSLHDRTLEEQEVPGQRLSK